MAVRYSDDLSLAHVLADAADSISMARFRALDLSVESKPDLTPVSDADTAVETALRATLARTRPRDGVLGEEFGITEAAAGPGTRQWVIDPIDATKNFVRGIPVFATLIGCVVGGEVVAGVASAPALGERWDAAVGEGSRRNGERVQVSRIAALANAHVLHGGLDWHRGRPEWWETLGRIADEAWRTRGFGDFWMHLLVAGGMAEVAFERDVNVWDVAALACIVAEAGGRMTTFDGGSPLGAGDILTTNGLLHQRMQALLADTG
jgi:histidinol-phosphatase